MKCLISIGEKDFDLSVGGLSPTQTKAELRTLSRKYV